MLTQTMQELLDEVSDQADVVWNARNPLTLAMERVVRAYRSLMSFGSSRGFSYFTQEQAPLTAPTAPTVAGDRYVEVPWPVSLRTIERVSLKVPNSTDWLPMSETSWQHLQGLHLDRRSSVDRVFAFKSYGAVTANAEVAGVVALSPIPPNGSQYRLSGLPHIPAADATVDEDLLLAFPDQNWVDRLVYDCCLRLDVRGRSSKKQANNFAALKAGAESEIGHAIVATVNTGAMTMRRSRNYRR